MKLCLGRWTSARLVGLTGLMMATGIWPAFSADRQGHEQPHHARHEPPAPHERLTPWSAPQNLGPVVNSAANDQHPAISPDGLSLYFVSDRIGGVGGFDLWVAHRNRVDTPWLAPVPLSDVVNSAFTEFAPTLDSSGHFLVFGSDRPGGCGDRDLWVSYRRQVRDDLGWQTPVNLGCTVNFSGFDDGPTLFEDRRAGGLVTLYFTSQNRPGGSGDFDVWASTMNPDGSYNPPVNVAELNSPARDTRTAIRRDGLEILLTTLRPGGNGLLDLWAATRETTAGTWSTPVNLGSVINSTANDGAPALSRDGLTLYFYSDRVGGEGATDLYVATRRRIRHR